MNKTFRELQKTLKKDSRSLPTLKVALLGDSATQFLATAIKATAIDNGYNINLFEADYNQVERQFMDPTSELYSFKADYIVVFQSTHKLLSRFNKLEVAVCKDDMHLNRLKTYILQLPRNRRQRVW